MDTDVVGGGGGGWLLGVCTCLLPGERDSPAERGEHSSIHGASSAAREEGGGISWSNSRSKRETFNQLWMNVGPLSKTLAQHWKNVGLTTSVKRECTIHSTVQSKQKICANAGLMLAQRLRRWPNIKPTLECTYTQQCIVLECLVLP